ncbi:cellular tumor antigen p53 [Chelonus insularis]|uniref:cellular tumor antigen p53 n=1 Tax=Chelonus insularis TaxID=460826 RepID=UPI00158B992C|nr:cellular tumor antigen p53 [Chelonus insularis]
MFATSNNYIIPKSDLYDENVFDELSSHVDINDLPILQDEILSDKKYLISNIPQESNHIQMNHGNYEHVSSTNISMTEEFPGVYNLEILFAQGKGKSFVYSQALRKVFIDMEHRLPLRVKWNPPENNLWLRATLVYTEDQYRRDPVQRCHNHMATTSPSNLNVSMDIVQQVVRCLHPSSIYEKINGHMTVVVPLGTPPPGCTYVPLDFQFYCKNSCSSGMNRRATQIIFTLETHEKETIGRRILQLRVCSCPKRDKEKEESEMNLFAPVGKKRKLPSFATISSKNPRLPPGKKLLNSNRNSGGGIVLSFEVPNKEIGKEALWDVYKILSAKATMTGDFALYSSYLDDIKKKFNEL